MLASVGANDNNNDRPSFTKVSSLQGYLCLTLSLQDGFYSGYDINGMYTKNSQTEVIESLTGGAGLGQIYVLGGDIYLARGHLAPNADFMTYAWQVRHPCPAIHHPSSSQDATFSFIDVAPQWQSFNAGNWLDVENGVRFLAEYVYGELQVPGILQPPLHSIARCGLELMVCCSWRTKMGRWWIYIWMMREIKKFQF